MDIAQYVGYLIFLTIFTMGFWLMIFVLTFVVPYWIFGAAKESRQLKKAAKKAANS
ncbi:MAG: hypothetical protein V3U80_03235 [Flavobacteriaceae bacterium]